MSAVPPGHWSAAWKLEPAAVLAAAAKSDFADLLTEAWSQAAVRSRDAGWAAALFRASLARAKDAPRVDLFVALPPNQQAALFTEAMAAEKLSIQAAGRLVSDTDFPLDRSAANLPLARMALREAHQALASMI